MTAQETLCIGGSHDGDWLYVEIERGRIVVVPEKMPARLKRPLMPGDPVNESIRSEQYTPMEMVAEGRNYWILICGLSVSQVFEQLLNNYRPKAKR